MGQKKPPFVCFLKNYFNSVKHRTAGLLFIISVYQSEICVFRLSCQVLPVYRFSNEINWELCIQGEL